jgi:large subunit ribosomal protein L3
MTGVWNDEGRKIPVTILQLDRTQITHVKTKSEHGYNAVQVGAGLRQPRNVTKAMLGHFARATVFPKQRIAEFRTLHPPTSAEDARGTLLTASHFKPGQYVDIRSVSKGKGFAGVMKRYGFKGLRASHGVSISHRAAGSMGQSQDPGRVLPGKKMAGRMGGKRVTVQNVKIVEVDEEAGTLMVKGPVPGPKDSWIMVQDAIKKPLLL